MKEKEYEDLDIRKIPIYVINLPNAKERLKRISDRLNYFGLKFKSFRAISPNSPRFENFEAINSLRENEKACAYSHYSLWQHMVKHHIKHMLILEDDIMFEKNWLEKMDKVPSNFDALFLNSSEKIYPCSQWVKIFGQYMAGAYILSNKGAKYLVEKNRNIKDVADYMTVDLQGRGYSYGYFPWLAIQEYENSQIQDEKHLCKDKDATICKLNDCGYNYSDYI